MACCHPACCRQQLYPPQASVRTWFPPSCRSLLATADGAPVAPEIMELLVGEERDKGLGECTQHMGVGVVLLLTL